MLQRQQQFDAARSRADNADPRTALCCQHARARGLEAREKPVDGFHRDRVLPHARHLQHAGRRADVDRQHIERHGWPVVAHPAFGRQVQSYSLAVVEPRAGEAAQRTGIDMRLIGGVMAGDHAR